jgi:putative spermidine/putrescine transport system permease protein
VTRQPASKQAVIWAIVVFDLIFLAAPTLVVLATSFTASNIIAFPPQGFSLKWYQALLERENFQDAFWRSAQVALICTVLAIPAGVLAGLAMVRYRLPLRGLFQTYLMLPFTVPLVVSGVAMMILFGQWGILGQLWPVGVAACVINLPFMIWAVSASANALDMELENAAANCGASPLMAFFTVTLPAVMPGVITGALIMFVLAFNEFVVSLFLVDRRTMTLPVEIYLSVRDIITPDVAAASVVYFIVACAAIAILDRIVGLDIFLRSK